MLAAISAGGVTGSLARYALAEVYPHRLGGFAWATFGINVSGCLLIGVVMVLVTDLWPTRTLLRPFLGTGVLGGCTTFSAREEHRNGNVRSGILVGGRAPRVADEHASETTGRHRSPTLFPDTSYRQASRAVAV